MKCLECGGTYQSYTGELSIKDDCIGEFTVARLTYMKCGSCGDLMFAPTAARLIENSRKSALENAIKSRPLKEFISASEAAAILGISRQALHKHRRIRRGFIFQTHFDGKIVYLKRSVLRFKQISDGRFPLLSRSPMAAYSGWLTTTGRGSWEEVLNKRISSEIFSNIPAEHQKEELAYG